MTTIDDYTLSSDRLHRSEAATRVAQEASLASPLRGRPDEPEEWTQFIDDLVEWMRDPGVFDNDDEFLPPAREVIHAAIQFALRMRDGGSPAPARVIADGEGGVVFERRFENVFVSLRFGQDQWIEEILFVDCRVQSRGRFSFPAFALM